MIGTYIRVLHDKRLVRNDFNNSSFFGYYKDKFVDG